jgi:hypothetical protein
MPMTAATAQKATDAEADGTTAAGAEVMVTVGGVTSGVAGATGVTLELGADAAPVPTAFVAATVNV